MITPEAWTVKPLSNVVEIQRGFDLPNHARRPGKYPVLTAGETGGFHNEGPIKGPGVTIGRATNLGKPKWSDIDFWPHNTTMFVKDFKGNNRKWVFHLFEATDLSGFDSGSVQPMLNRNYIAQVPVPVPPLIEQQAIAEVLGALDDKIMANTKISQITNDLAGSLFRSALRQAEFRNDTFADLAQVSGGGTPSTKNPDFWNGNVRWATPTDITGLTGPYLESTSRVISDAGLKACSSDLFPKGSILMTSRATIGAFAIAQNPTAVNQGFIVVQPHDPKLRYWIFHEMQSRVDEFTSLANGATFLELSRGNFKKLRVRQAPVDVIRKFNEQASSLHEMARSALTENITLAETRDALLPQLMSGKLRVKDAEARVESVV